VYAVGPSDGLGGGLAILLVCYASYSAVQADGPRRRRITADAAFEKDDTQSDD
jgi:hypothetical protein